jgi:RNA polymerase sigma factor (TIGR02999 family)
MNVYSQASTVPRRDVYGDTRNDVYFGNSQHLGINRQSQRTVLVTALVTVPTAAPTTVVGIIPSRPIDVTPRSLHTKPVHITARWNTSARCDSILHWLHRDCMSDLGVVSKPSVTQLIAEADANVPRAINRLFDVLYKDLYRVAHNRLRTDGRVLDLSATSLLHETYERLVKLNELKVTDSTQFFTYAATVMRSVVVDMARGRLAERRGGGSRDIHIDTALEAQIATPLDESVVQISEALDQLEAIEPRLARVIEMRYFSGMSVQETAAALGITLRTVGRDWVRARSLLAALLTG